MNIKRFALFVSLLAVLLSACTTNQNVAQYEAEANARDADYYVPTRGLERRNYNWRMELSDCETCILWCTTAFTTPGAPIFTVPVLTKLTSGGKRPWRLESSSGYENPGADGMYGSSGDYRYGFGPTGKFEYHEFHNLQTYCTTKLTVWQKEATTLVLVDQELSDASLEAERALQAGDLELAGRILSEAIQSAEDEKEGDE